MNETGPDTGHIVKTFDEELTKLASLIGRMGGLAEHQVRRSVESLIGRDVALANDVVASDKEIDALEQEVNELVLQVLALRQPMAVDLRNVVSALKVAADIERIGDYAKNIAKRSIAVGDVLDAQPVRAISRISTPVVKLLRLSIDAFLHQDTELAMQVWNGDKAVDEAYNGLFREILTYMMEDPRTISAGAHLLFVAKNLERIGDLSTNVAETIYFAVTGTQLPEDRPKATDSSLMVETDGE